MNPGTEDVLWSWRCDADGNVTICVASPARLEVRVSRRDVEAMADAGSPEMRRAHELIAEYRQKEARMLGSRRGCAMTSSEAAA